MGCLLCLVGTWGLIRAAYWFSSAPSIPGVIYYLQFVPGKMSRICWFLQICMFLVPLLLVPVLTSPYARVSKDFLSVLVSLTSDVNTFYRSTILLGWFKG